jgi:hypothetical protein
MLMYKNYIITLIAFIALLTIGYIFYDKYSVTTVSYTGLGDSVLEPVEVKKDIIITSENPDSEKLEFVQRKITGGGDNPGWVISLLETQPNIFTGRVIVDDGVYQHPVTLKEQVTNIFVGEMKGVGNTKEIFTLKKENKECTDPDGSLFEYSLSGTYGATAFSGCGGDLLKESSVE